MDRRRVHPASTRDTSPPGAVAALARVAGIPSERAADLLAHYGSLRALRGIDGATLRTGHSLTSRQAARLIDAFALAACLIVEPAAVHA